MEIASLIISGVSMVAAVVSAVFAIMARTEVRNLKIEIQSKNVSSAGFVGCSGVENCKSEINN
jgi:hypothetical protein